MVVEWTVIVIAAEKNFENRLKKFLEDEGCWFVKFFANAYTKSGIPDLLINCNGYFVAVEVKAQNGKPSELQKWNIKIINEQGGYGVILFPDQFDDFKKLIQCIYDDRYGEAANIVRRINERWFD